MSSIFVISEVIVDLHNGCWIADCTVFLRAYRQILASVIFDFIVHIFKTKCLGDTFKFSASPAETPRLYLLFIFYHSSIWPAYGRGSCSGEKGEEKDRIINSHVAVNAYVDPSVLIIQWEPTSECDTEEVCLCVHISVHLVNENYDEKCSATTFFHD